MSLPQPLSYPGKADFREAVESAVVANGRVEELVWRLDAACMDTAEPPSLETLGLIAVSVRDLRDHASRLSELVGELDSRIVPFDDMRSEVDGDA